MGPDAAALVRLRMFARASQSANVSVLFLRLLVVGRSLKILSLSGPR